MSMILRMAFVVGVAGSIWMSAPSALAQTAFERQCARLASEQRKDAERLHQLLALHWEYTLRENPDLATYFGYPGYNDRWPDLSLQAIERRKRELRAAHASVLSIDRSQLDAQDQLNYDLFRNNVESDLEGGRFKSEYLQLTQLGGVQQDAARLLASSPHANVKDYEDIIARLRGLPKVIEQTLILLQKGVETGITPPRITLRDVPGQVKSHLAHEPEQNPLLVPFLELPSEIPEAERVRLRKQAVEALEAVVLPAYGRLHEFLVKSYLPRARATIAIKDLPDGDPWYAYNVRMRTTTTLTPQKIHELGLSEVKRIRAAMDAVISASKFKGSFDDFCKFLREDRRFYYTDAEELLKGYRDIAKRADAELPRLFQTLPRLTYGVQAVPKHFEKSHPTAHYMPGSLQAGRAGMFVANTYALDKRPKWEMEALTLHEAVPGHHLQMALARELEGIPDFRRHGDYTAFVEGWGLYAESLGSELGFYKDPYMKFGQLSYEMWRAIRLVVDTGIHAMGWTRQQAIDFFFSHSSKNLHDITVEVDRYIVWPGQALAYKLGELKIKELRAHANRELGAKFDLRGFHDVVLGAGPLPLDLLDRRVRAWVVEQARQHR